MIIGLFLVCFDLGDLGSVLFVVLSFCLVFLLLRERERTSRWVGLELGRSGRSLGSGNMFKIHEKLLIKKIKDGAFDCRKTRPQLRWWECTSVEDLLNPENRTATPASHMSPGNVSAGLTPTDQRHCTSAPAPDAHQWR